MKIKLNFSTIILFLFFTLQNSIVFSQDELNDTIRIEIFDNNEPLPGVLVKVKFSNPNIERNTDIKGVASIIVPKNMDKIILSFLGPYFEFKIYRPVDFIRIDLCSRNIIYYYKGKKYKKIRFKNGF